MLILSTFILDQLQSPLQSLFQKFTSESITLRYSNKNLMGDLLNLNLEKSYAILLRLFDFAESDSITSQTKLNEYLKLILERVTQLKNEKISTFIVFLCPSPHQFKFQLENIEKSFIKKLNKNKVYTLTLADIQEKYGLIKFENPTGEDTHTPYSPIFYKAIACLLARKFHAIKKGFQNFKVIISDCDNTIWTGAAGDGPKNIIFKEHNLLFQQYLVAQQERGIIICLCSRNANEKIILDVFAKRKKDMVLKLKHITIYKINEELKSENIKKIAVDLNLSPNSFRFIDDNPLEINDVRQIPGVFCITMPQNLEEYKKHWAFDIDEHAEVTETDKKRTELYKHAEVRAASATRFSDPIEFLRSSELGQTIFINEINSIYSEFDKQAIARVSQLSGRTNQFNLFPEATKEINELNAIVNNDKRKIFIGSIKDNFSAEEITAIVISSFSRNSLTINSFFLSCRVFRRGMEYEMLKHIAQFAQEKGLKCIKLKFKKSTKNTPASDFLNILSEAINKDPISKVLLNKCKFTLTLSTQKIIDLEIDSLIRASLNISQKSSLTQQDKIILSDNNNITEKYLIDLKKITDSLLFIDDKEIDFLSEENKIIQKCNHCLGEEGQDKSLVARGLDSLKATELRYYLYEINGINISISKLLCEKMTAFTLVEYIKEQEKSSKTVFINENPYNKVLPVSFQQQRIWIAEQKERTNNASTNYHIIVCYKVSKGLDIPRFKLACQKLIELYDVFGASFFMQEGSLKQSILAPENRKLNFQEIELIEISLEEAIKLEISKPWMMTSEAPLMRIILFKDASYHIFFHVHHAIFDAVSLKNCLDTLSKIYKNLLTSGSSKLIDYPPQYSDFICYQQKWENKDYQKAVFDFWQNELSKIESVNTLPNDQSISNFKSATELAIKRYTFTLSSKDLSALKNLAKLTRVTCFSALSALFGLLICAYTYQEHITLITATNGRNGSPTFDKMVGFFVNLLVHQFDLDGNEWFIEYLKKVNKKILASQAFQDIPFNKIQEILCAQGIKDILLSPAFIYQSYSTPELRLDNEMAELEVPEQPIILDKRETCRFGHFTLFAQENEEGLNFIIEYAKDLFSDSFIKRFSENFKHTIKNVCNNPHRKLQDISVVSDKELEELISLGQGPQINYAEDDSLIKRFQCSVEKYPDNNALCYDEVSLSYKEVDQQSTDLAHALINANVKQGDFVGIFLGANHLFFIAELAILKIGAIFVPLSKENPNERLKLIINDAKIEFIIVDNQTKSRIDNHFPGLISINADKFEHSDRELVTVYNKIFCVLYTSGSTGVPKGVILENDGILRVVKLPPIKILPGDKMAQTANQVFDAAQLECWLTWDHGACLVIFDKKTILDINLFRIKLKSEAITHMWLTAGLLDSFSDAPDLFEDLKVLLVGGDIIRTDIILKILKLKKYPTIDIVYGPTECHIRLTTIIATKDNYNTSLIGAPINNTELEIITISGTRTPIGGIGQLVGKGICVAKGYLNASELHKKRFREGPGKRSYQTGDLVKYTSIESQLIFLGRADNEQAKINGNLVALEEVRNCLVRHPNVKQVEIFVKNIHGNNHLVAFYTLKSVNEKFVDLAYEEFRSYLIKHLPSYMCPSFYIQMDDFKINTNGKLDQSQFQKFELKLNASEEIPPKTQNGKKILELIRKILPAFPNNIKTNFFNFGCDSISAMRITNEINNKFESEFIKIFQPEFEKEFKDKFNKRFESYLDEKIFHTIDLYQNATIDELENLLIKKLNNEIKKESLRILKNGDNNLPPIVFIHPAGGGLSCFNKLIEHVTFENACYGIEDPLLTSNQLKLLSMEQMAQDYLSILANEIQGSFILAGYSFGGMLALEMAAQYQPKSENDLILKVILFDTWVVSCASKDIKTKLKEEVLIFCDEQRKMTNVEENSSKLIALLEELCEHHQKIGFEYELKKNIFIPVYLLKAMTFNETFRKMNSQVESLQTKDNFLLLEELLTQEIEATHFDILKAPDKNDVAKYLSEQINEN